MKKKQIILALILLLFFVFSFFQMIKNLIVFLSVPEQEEIICSETEIENDPENDVEVVKIGEPKINKIIDDFQEQKEQLKEPEFICLGEFKLTAYCSCEKCCGKWALNRPIDENGNQIVYGVSGEILVPGVSVAVDPNVIEYGKTIQIDGKNYIAHDCGGAIKNNRIDVYFEDHQEALDFGVQYKTVYLMEG